jgi:hypothetical protein
LSREYDGEYRQVHIDLGENKSCIKIFSKCGNDSTNDRIDFAWCAEGEPEAWNDKFSDQKAVRSGGRTADLE